MGMKDQGIQERQNDGEGKPRSDQHHKHPKLEQVEGLHGQILPENELECISDASKDIVSRFRELTEDSGLNQQKQYKKQQIENFIQLIPQQIKPAGKESGLNHKSLIVQL